MSAGGSMVHPNVNGISKSFKMLGILMTPICPHTLSFRPLILPNSIVLHLQINENARATAYCSFDGRGRQELMKGDKIEIKTSHWPLPAITKTDQTSEWFLGLSKLLHWNLREQQKPLKKHSDSRMNLY
jgi:NAD+ kinase